MHVQEPQVKTQVRPHTFREIILLLPLIEVGQLSDTCKAFIPGLVWPHTFIEIIILLPLIEVGQLSVTYKAFIPGLTSYFHRDSVTDKNMNALNTD